MKVLRLVFGIFLLAGLGLLAGSFFAIQHTRGFLATAVPADGVVVENVLSSNSNSNGRGSSWSYFPRVHFRSAEGRDVDFVSNSGSNPPSYAINQPVPVLYDPQNPNHASINSFGQLWVLPMILGILGVGFTVPRAVLAIWQRASDKKNAWLLENGRRIMAEITSVGLNTSVQMNGRSPYRINCQWLDPSRNEMHVFHSGNIWFNPTEFLSEKTLLVWIDPDNPHRYTVDTSFLPKEV
jgi:hypothetical protein